MPGARQNPQAGRRMYAGGFPGLTKEEAQHQPLRLFRGSPGPVSQACPGSRGTAPVDAAPGNRRHRSESVGPYPYRRPPARPVRGTVQRSSVDGVKNSASRGACPAQEEIHAPDSASGQPAEASRLPRLDAGAGRLDHRVRPRGEARAGQGADRFSSAPGPRTAGGLNGPRPFRSSRWTFPPPRPAARVVLASREHRPAGRKPESITAGCSPVQEPRPHVRTGPRSCFAFVSPRPPRSPRSPPPSCRPPPRL